MIFIYIDIYYEHIDRNNKNNDIKGDSREVNAMDKR